MQREHPSLRSKKSIPRNAIADDANSAAPFAPDKGLPFGIGDTDAFGYASGLWQDMHDMLDCGKTDLGFARLVHFLALAYIVYHSGLTGLMRRTRTFLPLCLIGRYSLPVFATGTVLSAMGEVIVETRSEAFSHEVALGAAIVAGGILMHYLVARGLAAWRDGQRANVLVASARTRNLAAAWREQDKAMLDALSNADGRQQRASIDVLRREIAERSDWPRDVRSLGSSASILIATSEPVDVVAK